MAIMTSKDDEEEIIEEKVEEEEKTEMTTLMEMTVTTHLDKGRRKEIMMRIRQIE